MLPSPDEAMLERLADVGTSPEPQFVDMLLASSATHMPLFSPEQLARLIVAMAALQLTVPESWLEAAEAVLLQV